MEVPPQSTILERRRACTSTSTFSTEFTIISGSPGSSLPVKAGENNISGPLNLSLPIVIT